jgi:DNA repair protein RecN (Recombination protein N)
MLRFLSVRHLAVIDLLDVEFEPGLNVLTGETGAGKSIVVEAIDLLMGGRASADLVRSGEAQATIQAIFDTADGREVIVRRELSAQGRSRAFIDDALATSGALRQAGAQLLELHGQHEHQALLDPAEHLVLLDEFAGDADALTDLGQAFDAWRDAASALERTRLDDREKRARIEMATFQLQDIEKVSPTAGEDDALASERTVLASADRLSRWSSDAYEALYAGEHAALGSLATTWKRVAELAGVDARFAAFAAERDEIKSRLDDLALTLRAYREMLDASPERLQAVEDRLAALERVKRKYGPTLDDVIRTRERLREDLAALGASEERIAEWQRVEASARSTFRAKATERSATRRRAAAELGRALERDLAQLAMPDARVDIRVGDVLNPEAWSRSGCDTAELYLSANPGEDLRPLARIASGGELSRVMLALRLLAAPSDLGRTLVFDEVDAGIGGAAADAVGARLARLGATTQVLCVTHLAAIAARAGTHYAVSKQVRGGRTVTAVEKLDHAGRERANDRWGGGLAAGTRVRSGVTGTGEYWRTNSERCFGPTPPEGQAPCPVSTSSRPSAAR